MRREPHSGEGPRPPNSLRLSRATRAISSSTASKLVNTSPFQNLTTR
jgi:hypothetical protein